MRRTLTLTSDAYWLITANEEPLDEANREEADRLFSEYPEGFELKDMCPVKGTDLVKVTLVTFDTWKPDAYMQLTDKCRMEIKCTGDTSLQYRWTIEGTAGKVFDADITVNGQGKKEFRTPKGSILPVWKFTPYE